VAHIDIHVSNVEFCIMPKSPRRAAGPQHSPKTTKQKIAQSSARQAAEDKELDALSITSFCARHGISPAFFYRLQAEGRGPRIMKLGGRTLISREAAAEWRRALEAASAAEAEAQ
jgi:hypothetical protein